MSISNNPKTFYTLDDSRAFESDPEIKIVYFTEKGMDLYAAYPILGQIDRVMRNGYSWDYLMDNPIAESRTQVRIVRTTEAELAAHIAARKSVPTAPQPQVDHKAAILAEIDALPTSELTQDRLADLITDYLIQHGIHDFVIADEICVILGSRGILKTPASTISEPELKAEPEPVTTVADTTLDSTQTYTKEPEEPEKDESNLDQSVSSIGSISAWLISSIDSAVTSIQELTLNILPIPNNTDWILLD